MGIYQSKALFLLLVFFIIRINVSAQLMAQNKPDNLISWKESTPLPVLKGLSGGFNGIYKDVLLYAGGSNFEEPKWKAGTKQFYSAVYALPLYGNGNDEWKKVGELPFTVADGATVETAAGLICIGGTNGLKQFSDVFLLIWDTEKQAISINTHIFPPLPEGVTNLSAAVLGNILYVMGGKTTDNKAVNKVWALNIAPTAQSKGWQAIKSWPGPARFGAALVKQNNGERDCLYLIGGKSDETYLRDCYRFDPSAKDDEPLWIKEKDLPRPALLAPAVAMGPSHILVFSGSDGHDLDKVPNVRSVDDYQFPTDILAYHTITNTWTVMGHIPKGMVATKAVYYKNHIYLSGGEIAPGIRTNTLFAGKISSVFSKKGFKWLDYASLAGYFVLISAIGLLFNRKRKTAEHFLRGGQKMPFWAVGISVMATQVSAVGFMTIPAKSYATNWAYFAGVFTWFMIVPLVNWAFIPFYRKLNLTSAYQYLEARFDKKVRLLAAVIFVLFQLVRMGLVLYLPALALSAVLPINILTSILLMGVLSTLYTALGGIEAVIWIEVAQAILLFGGALLCFILAVNGLNGGLWQFWTVATQDHKLSLGNTHWSWVSTSMWVILLGNVFNRLGNLTSDQSIVQRYMTTADLASSRRTLWADVVASIPWAILIYALGTALYAFYQQHPNLLVPTMPTDSILPEFIALNAPAGVCGLIIAGIFAASMSALESSIHSVSTICFTDFYSALKPSLTDHKKMYFLKRITYFIGTLATLMSVGLLYLDFKSLLDFFTEALGVFAGASMGLFFLGIFSKRANATGALIGVIVTAVVMYAIVFFSPLNFWLYSVIGLTTCYSTGVIFSLLSNKPANFQGLSIRSIK